MDDEVIGLVPAAGEANRMGPLPCSKEILPIGIRSGPADPRVKVASHVLLERMRHAGISKVFVILRDGKEDIPRFLGDGQDLGLRLEYLTTDSRSGPPFTLDRAYPMVRGARIATGFPDILFEPEDAFSRLLERQKTTEADIVLGLFPTARAERMDMVAVDEEGRVRGLEIKPERTTHRFTWIIATWNGTFTEFLHEFVEEAEDRDPDAAGDYHVGDVFRSALEADLRVESVVFPQGRCLDIGTPEDYRVAIRKGGRA